MMHGSDDTTSRLLSHRLCGFSAHEGSLAGLGAALQLDVAWIEIDTRETADGQVIVFHDTRLDRITTASGRVRDYSISANGPLRYAGTEEQSVPTLAAFLQEFAAARISTRLMLDIKDPGTEEAHVELVREHGLEGHTWIIAWDPQILVRVHQLAPEIPLGFSHIPLTRLRPLLNGLARVIGDGASLRRVGQCLALLGTDHNAQDATVFRDSYNDSTQEASGFPIHLVNRLPGGHLGDILKRTQGGVGLPAAMLTPAYVRQAHEQRLKVFVYSIDSLHKARRAVRQCNPDIIFTNRSELFQGGQ